MVWIEMFIDKPKIDKLIGADEKRSEPPFIMKTIVLWKDILYRSLKGINLLNKYF